MRGSNAEIIWRRARAARRRSADHQRDCTLAAVSSRTHPKNVPVRQSWPELHRSRPPPAAAAEVRCLEGHARATGRLPGPPGQPVATVFRIKDLVCYMALASARPSRSSATTPESPRSSRSGDLQPRGCGRARELSQYTTRKRALKSYRLSETPKVWRNTSDTFTPRELGYNCASCESVKCFELKESDGELCRSCLRQQPAYLQPCARLVILGSEEDLRGNTVKLVE